MEGEVPPRAGRGVREAREQGARLHEAARSLRTDHAAAVAAVRAAFEPLQAELVALELESIPVARLRDVTEGRLRLGAVEAAGLRTVRAV
ncbi:hypothetical protein [Streptomyces sp. NPDC001292]|uniref:hypothetical protein n=1 Tax=Streptomyces sp. NPDC001292 TaxID=3364558 RepID=UPI0036854967